MYVCYTYSYATHTLHLWIGGKHLNGLMMLISVGIANQQGKHRFGWHIVTTRIRSYMFNAAELFWARNMCFIFLSILSNLPLTRETDTKKI